MIGCSGQDYSGGNSQSQVSNFSGSESDASSDQVLTTDVEMDSLPSGGGVTIGNGKSGSLEVEEASEPALILGSYSTCDITAANTVTCHSNEQITMADIELLTLINEDGSEIPSTVFDAEISMVDDGKYMLTIVVPDDYDLVDVLVSSSEEEEKSEAENKGKDKGPKDSAPQETASTGLGVYKS